jgi:fumarate reductase subunit D
MLDNLWNAMVNPIYVLIIGGMVALGASARRAQPRRQPGGFAVVPRPMVARPAVAMAG